MVLGTASDMAVADDCVYATDYVGGVYSIPTSYSPGGHWGSMSPPHPVRALGASVPPVASALSARPSR